MLHYIHFFVKTFLKKILEINKKILSIFVSDVISVLYLENSISTLEISALMVESVFCGMLSLKDCYKKYCIYSITHTSLNNTLV